MATRKAMQGQIYTLIDNAVYACIFIVFVLGDFRVSDNDLKHLIDLQCMYVPFLVHDMYMFHTWKVSTFKRFNELSNY